MRADRECRTARSDVFKMDRLKVPHVHPDVHAVPMSQPVVVDMTKHHERIAAGVVPREHRVMAQRMTLVFRPIAHLGQRRDCVPRQGQNQILVVVAGDEMLAPARQQTEQVVEPVAALGARPHGEVAQDPEIVLSADAGLQIVEQDLLYVGRAVERALAERDDVVVPKVGVCRLPVDHVLFLFVKGDHAGGDWFLADVMSRAQAKATRDAGVYERGDMTRVQDMREDYGRSIGQATPHVA